jgi:hypothetical protein
LNVIPVYVVRRFPEGVPAMGEDKPVEIVSAWSDVYAAKHEASRWEQDTKVAHDYIEGVLILAQHSTLR